MFQRGDLLQKQLLTFVSPTCYLIQAFLEALLKNKADITKEVF